MLSPRHLLPTLWLLLFQQICTASYTLKDDYGNDEKFFDKFDFSQGYVSYVDRSTAKTSGLISASGGSVYFGVDTRNSAWGSGRQSVRLTSHQDYTHGLVVLDLAHMPGSVCGTWPAFWMIGTVPPTAGEIDIIEGMNEGPTNLVTLHTNHDGCTVNNSGFSGILGRDTCYIYSTGLGGSGGCSIVDPNPESYGGIFNGGGGGVYATEWTSDVIRVWHFSRSKIPGNVQSGSPDPSTWGTPVASFSGGCNIDAQFNNLHLVFDITFCGDWAGGTWASSRVCASKAPTCVDYVRNNPRAFEESYWRVNSLKVYQRS
ncbi:Endo-1-3(4)-beta-glucanase [Penicillium longicatenatum]|uniref:Endo-1-3(4)-beta-glucanase n=1 Tax=Penicillium longicatenatum TaxID=1561947 RepID=UPI002548AF01|nr:Endo-1-3(4)-beta-glucanase [Penicillium longicatenatum]KAJ5639942.1 Endo-1-3(4)-beta-glucanase [Penicillium longicatenatum]